MKKKNNAFKNIALITQLGINVMVPTFVCMFIGKWLDSLFNTSFLIIVFLILGILGGGKSAYTIAMDSLMMDSKKDDPQKIVDEYNRKNSDRRGQEEADENKRDH